MHGFMRIKSGKNNNNNNNYEKKRIKRNTDYSTVKSC
jgi:hypothetical protein